MANVCPSLCADATLSAASFFPACLARLLIPRPSRLHRAHPRQVSTPSSEKAPPLRMGRRTRQALRRPCLADLSSSKVFDLAELADNEARSENQHRHKNQQLEGMEARPCPVVPPLSLPPRRCRCTASQKDKNAL